MNQSRKKPTSIATARARATTKRRHRLCGAGSAKEKDIGKEGNDKSSKVAKHSLSLVGNRKRYPDYETPMPQHPVEMTPRQLMGKMRKLNPEYEPPMLQHLVGMTPRQRMFIRKNLIQSALGRTLVRKFLLNMTRNAKQSSELIRKKIKRRKLCMSMACAPYAFHRSVGSKQLLLPECVVIGPDGNIVVSDTGNGRIQVFRYTDGVHLRTIRIRDIYSPGDITFDREGNLLVVDRYNNCFHVVNYADGTLTRTVRVIQQNPCAIAVAPDGDILVHCTEVLPPRGRPASINRYSPAGNPTDSIGGWSYAGVGAWLRGNGGIAFDPNGSLVLACTDANLVQVFDYTPRAVSGEDGDAEWARLTKQRMAGNYFASVSRNLGIRNGNPGDDPGKFSYPRSVAFDAEGRLVVADLGNKRVQVMKYPEGTDVNIIDCCVEGDKTDASGAKMCTPYCVAIAPNGDIVVCDRTNGCIKIFK